MMYTSQYDDAQYELDSGDCFIGDSYLDSVFENNDFSCVEDLDDIS